MVQLDTQGNRKRWKATYLQEALKSNVPEAVNIKAIGSVEKQRTYRKRWKATYLKPPPERDTTLLLSIWWGGEALEKLLNMFDMCQI